MMEEEVNKKYIAVVTKQIDEVLEFKREELSNEYADVIDRLQEMQDNPNRTVLDMQGCFTKTFNREEYFHLCLQYHYASSYITGVCYPQLLTYNEYDSLLTEKKNKSVGDQEQIEKQLSNYKHELKEDFLQKCKRYIEGYNFAKVSSKCQ